MEQEVFMASVKSGQMPDGLTIYMETLWYAGAGDWNKAHELIQDLPGKDAAVLHAHLHRVEGDQWNADYWYSKAGEKRPDVSLQQEWEALVKRYL